MRKVGTLVGLSLVALTATARAQDAAPAVPAAPEVSAPAPAASISSPAREAAPPAASPRKLQLGLSFLPMALGKVNSSAAGISSTDDGSFAYGFGLLASYEIFSGFSVGVAPQLILNGKVKETPAAPAKQIDVLARVAYAYTIPKVVTLYAEVLPGYSLIVLPEGKSPKGMVLVMGVGAAIDLSERAFVNLGVGYEKGFQKQTAVSDHKVDYVRLALGGGFKF